jgi:hypothetical protein
MLPWRQWLGALLHARESPLEVKVAAARVLAAVAVGSSEEGLRTLETLRRVASPTAPLPRLDPGPLGEAIRPNPARPLPPSPSSPSSLPVGCRDGPSLVTSPVTFPGSLPRGLLSRDPERVQHEPPFPRRPLSSSDPPAPASSPALPALLQLERDASDAADNVRLTARVR